MKPTKLFILLLLSVFASSIMAQGFEGTIDFKRKNYFDETNYTYTIGKGKVRVDEYDKDGKITGTMFIDLKTKEVTAINHERKMHMKVESRPSKKDLSRSMVYKTSEKKEIQGYPCTKWVVDNSDFKTKAEYWVIDNANYFFFKDLLAALNRKDKIALYFMFVPENAGFFPIMGKEIAYDGKVKDQFITKKITRKKISSDVFKIPAGYKEFK